ncbi:MAG: hypothetical protein IE932_00025 [Sphingopyxis terrae]|nr:hypothetical protein [Sphingopyxis terrae]
MVTAELRVGWHGAGPVRAVAWWAFADGTTSDQLQALRPTREQAVQAVREAAQAMAEGKAPASHDGRPIDRYAPPQPIPARPTPR